MELQTGGWTGLELGQLIMKEGATLLLGILNFEADRYCGEYTMFDTLKLRLKSTNLPMTGRLIGKDSKDLPSAKIFVERQPNFRWRQLVHATWPFIGS